jgi:hypothetical protein
MITPEDCELAEEISHNSPELAKILLDRYGITDPKTQVACDPWSVHLADEKDEVMAGPDPETGVPRRLIQTFLYFRPNGIMADNHCR